ncbi:lipopolysaccharide transport periplasmic protein LptA [Psychrosphaera sp. B3R10]|uniref:lipopolysaccharide transport periplasmic protein LptA n=1 Tax=unclassified Psychrosphaera TaxID=2641570 RepID=UPI001C08B0EC|nr:MULTISPECIES: lipopolysaccharide transport periplasmic protein LptA [unclassified Psychrosphaera]MBU2881924.1 lipopolysaccharide transport periplasmic protein LptA [Psychrosphaera sp. I2R16]MBU2991235.1 lipopolysaccharide transport periplasmic protein LptA [Psychrosphaera sp. B3R10]MDO6720999.1 lipopolysaccharide transport periplasmic protein LptA [Psychrosphaera sp. 1_MG-2023]
MTFKRHAYIATILVALFSMAVSANSEDLKIKSDNQDLNYNNNTMYFKGNVVVSQGPISIKADELFVDTQDGTGEKLIAKGSPALFTQIDEENGNLTAKANEIEYFVTTQTLKLSGDAKFKQGGSEVQSGSIEFDLAKKRVKADGDASTGGRVTTTIKTKKKNG